MDYIYEDEMKNLFIEGTVPDKNEAPRYIEMLRRVKSYEVLMFLAKQEKLPEIKEVKEEVKPDKKEVEAPTTIVKKETKKTTTTKKQTKTTSHNKKNYYSKS